MPNTTLARLQEPDVALGSQLRAIRKQFQKSIQRTTTGMLMGGEEKFVVHRFPDAFAKKYDHLEVLPISDVQFGHKCCRVDKLVEYLTWVEKEPYRFIILVGDSVDAWSSGSPGDGYDNLFRPDSQVYRFCETIAPVRHRILGSVGSNHGRRGLKGGVDLDGLISVALETPYSAGAQMISVHFGKHQPFKFYVWHGRGAARTAGGMVNMSLSVVPNDVRAHVYINGHIHHAYAWNGWRAYRDEEAMTMRAERYYVVSTTSFLDFWGSYGELGGYTVSGLLMPLVLTFTDGRYRVEL